MESPDKMRYLSAHLGRYWFPFTSVRTTNVSFEEKRETDSIHDTLCTPQTMPLSSPLILSQCLAGTKTAIYVSSRKYTLKTIIEGGFKIHLSKENRDGM